MGHKSAERTQNISNTFGPGTANECTVWWWLKKFCKGDESLADEECSGEPLEVDNNQLKTIIEADPLTTTWEVVEEFNIDLSIVVCIWSKLERQKSLINGCLMRWLKIKKKHCFEVFSYSTQQRWTISLSNCDVWQKVDLIWQLETTSSVVGLGSSKALPIAKLVAKNGRGHCLGVCCLSDPLQLSEAQWNHCLWEVCSANWWDALKTPTLSASIGLLHDNT